MLTFEWITHYTWFYVTLTAFFSLLFMFSLNAAFVAAQNLNNFHNLNIKNIHVHAEM